MKNHRAVFLLWAWVVAVGALCYCSKSPTAPPLADAGAGKGQVVLSLSLSKPAQPIDRVLVIAKHASLDSVSGELTITGNVAEGTLEVPAAEGWVVVVKLYAGDILCYAGASEPVDVFAGKRSEVPTIGVRQVGELVAEAVFITWPGETQPIDLEDVELFEGDEVEFNVLVRNRGSITLTGWGSVTFLDDVFYKRGQDHSIDAKSSKIIYTGWTAQAGEHRVVMAVDPDDTVKESDETNNSATLAFAVQPRPQVDLVAENVFVTWVGQGEVIDFNGLVAGDEVDLNMWVTNRGQADAGGWAWTVLIDGVLYSRDDDLFVAGQSNELVWVSWTATPGEHTVVIEVDVDDVVRETDENNNVSILTFIVGEGVDLVAEEVFISWPGEAEPIDPNSLVEGDEVRINVRVRNTSATDITGWSSRSFIDGEPYRSGTEHFVPAHSTTLIFAPWTVVAGTHIIEIVVDVDDVVRETDESNNAASLDFTVGGMGIVAGQGVDAVQLGFDKAQVIAALGDPYSIEDRTWWSYDEIGIGVGFDGNEFVDWIEVHAPYVGTTERGIGLGATDALVESAYGGDYILYTYEDGFEAEYAALGISFFFGWDSFCRMISVFSPYAAKPSQADESVEGVFRDRRARTSGR